MQTSTSHGINWWVGSNGNLFGDHDGFRYCIASRSEGGYTIVRNGHEFAKAPSVADAKIIIARQ